MSRVSIALATLAVVVFGESVASAQNVPLDNRFRYQGELRNAGVVVDGVVDLELSIFDQPTLGNQIGTTQTVLNVTVSRGVFEVDVPFSTLSFAGDKRHLQVAVRSPAGAGAYTTLNPRIELLPTPNAHYARVAGLAFGSNSIGGVSLTGLVQKAEGGSITLGMLATGAVNSAAIADGSIVGADIAANTITAANIVAGTITGTEIAANTINSGDIQNGAVTLVDLAADSVDSSKIVDGSIGAADLASNSIDSTKILNGSITASDLAIGAIDGGNAGTVDGLEAAQFLRADVPDTINASEFVIAAGSPNIFTFGGTNLDLRLGDSVADVVSVPGSFSVGGSATLGDAVSDSVVISGSMTFPDNGLLGPSLTLGTDRSIRLSASSNIDWDNFGSSPGCSLTSAPLGTGAWNRMLRVGGGVTLAQGRLLAGGIEYGASTLASQYNRFGGWDSVSDINPISGTISTPSDVFVTRNLEVAGSASVVGDLRLGLEEGDSNIYFYDQASAFANRIRWADTGTLSCVLFGQLDSYFQWRISDSTNTGWVFADGSDSEVFIDETGNVVIDGTLTQSSGCDLAEMFFSNDRIEPGTVVAIDPNAPEYVVASSRAGQYGLVGVVSSNAGILLNGPAADALPFVAERNEVEQALSSNPENPELEHRFLELERMIDSWPRGDVPVALAGRVPVKVIGAVEAGDPLTSSDVPGHAMAVKSPGPAIGIALESKASAGAGTVLMIVQPGYHAPRGFDPIGGDVGRQSVSATASPETTELVARIASLEKKFAESALVDGSSDARDSDARLPDGSRSPDSPNGRTERRDRNDPATEAPVTTVVQLRKEAWGDFDADGKDDVFVLNPVASSKLYRNLGDGTFQDVTADAGFVTTTGIRIALWEDFDGDRSLDLLLVDGSGAAKLYRGLGLGRFQDVTLALGLDFGKPIVDAEWIDHDRDGKPDLRVAIADGRLLLHHNLGGGTFRTSELRSPITFADEGAKRIESLEAENAAIRAQLDELKTLISGLAADAGAKR